MGIASLHPSYGLNHVMGIASLHPSYTLAGAFWRAAAEKAACRSRGNLRRRGDGVLPTATNA
jgi:hypothetical protein